MKKRITIVAFGLAVAFCGASVAKADSLKNLLGKLGDVASETVAQNTSVSLSDMAGTWTASGPAVVLKSDNVLEQAGGSAVSSTIEDKLQTYYDKLGISNTTITIGSDGSVSMTLKKIPVSGTLTATDESGAFTLQISGLSKLSKSNSTMTVYVQKSSSSMSMTVDAEKLKSILEAVADKADNSTINSAMSLLNSYDKVCLGFRLTK